MRSVCLNFEISNPIGGLASSMNNSIDSEKIAKELVVKNYNGIIKTLNNLSSEFGSLFKYSISISEDALIFFQNNFPEFIDSINSLNRHSMSLNQCVSNIDSIDNNNKFSIELVRQKEKLNSLLNFPFANVINIGDYFTRNVITNSIKSGLKAICYNSDTDVNNSIIQINDLSDLKLIKEDYIIQKMFKADANSLDEIVLYLKAKSENTQLVYFNLNFSDFVNNKSLLEKLSLFPEKLMSESDFTFNSLSEIISYSCATIENSFLDTVPENLYSLFKADSFLNKYMGIYKKINLKISKCRALEISNEWQDINSLQFITNYTKGFLLKEYFNKKINVNNEKIKQLVNFEANLEACIKASFINKYSRFADIERLPKIKLKKMLKGFDGRTIFYSIQNQSPGLKDKILSNIPLHILDEIELLIEEIGDGADSIEIRNARRRVLSKLKKI